MHKFKYPAGRFASLQATRLSTACLFTTLLLLFLSIAGRLQALTVSEIMYHSSTAGGTGDEFIELYNENVDPIDLSGYSICNGINFVFPRGTYLDGHSYLVVCADEAAIRDRYGITNTIGDWAGSLDNSGERIEICNTGGRVVLEMRYNDRGKWPVGDSLPSGGTVVTGDNIHGPVMRWARLAAVPDRRNNSRFGGAEIGIIAGRYITSADTALRVKGLAHRDPGPRVPANEQGATPGKCAGISGMLGHDAHRLDHQSAPMQDKLGLETALSHRQFHELVGRRFFVDKMANNPSPVRGNHE